MVSTFQGLKTRVPFKAADSVEANYSKKGERTGTIRNFHISCR